jgi:hypothetical protein
MGEQNWNKQHRAASMKRKSHRDDRLPGCSWDKASQKWRACIMVGGKEIFVAYHDTEQEAYNALLKFEKETTRMER